MLAVNTTQIPVLPQASLVPAEPLRVDNQRIPLVTPTKPSQANVASKSATEQRASVDGTQADSVRSQATSSSENPVVQEKNSSGDSRGDGRQQNGNSAQSDPEVLAQLQELRKRDREVRSHEQAHASVGGDIAGAPSLVFKKGPDGRLYAVDGEVPISTRPVPGSPERTIAKLEQVIRAALAPVQPSTQDVRVATQAAAMISQLKAELAAGQEDQGAQEAPRLLGDRATLERRIGETGATASGQPGLGQHVDKVA
jgi:hypothetical protein